MSEGSQEPVDGMVVCMADFPEKGFFFITLDPRLPGRVFTRKQLDDLIDCLRFGADQMDGIVKDQAFISVDDEPTRTGSIDETDVIATIRRNMETIGQKPLEEDMVRVQVPEPKPEPWKGRLFVIAPPGIGTSWVYTHGLRLMDRRIIRVTGMFDRYKMQGYAGHEHNRYIIVGEKQPWMDEALAIARAQGFGELTPAEAIALLKGE